MSVDGSEGALQLALRLGQRTWARYTQQNGELLAAALAFYSLLSIAPVAILAIMAAGLVFEAHEAREVLVRLIREVAAPSVARNTTRALDTMREVAGEGTATAAGVTLLLASSRLFTQLQAALNAIWGVRVTPEGARAMVKQLIGKRLLAFAMVAAAGALLLLLVILNSVLSALAQNLVRTLPISQLSPVVVMVQNYLLVFILLALFFVAIYRVLPDARISWRDAWFGASLTATFMLLGTILLNLVIGALTGSAVVSTLGSIAALVVWIYYQGQVFLLGAAFTREWVEHLGHHIEPDPEAELRRSLPPA